MRTNLIFWLCLMFSSTTLAGVKIEHWQTSQGARVFYVQSQGLPLVDIQVLFDAGSARDGKQYGIAALTADLLATSAGQWNADQIAQRLENVGARFGTAAGIDSASLTLRSLTEPQLFSQALDTLQVILTQPRFTPADFQRQKNQTLAGLKQREESPAAVAKLALDKAAYSTHPYAYAPAGYLENVTALQVEDLKRFYQHYYVASNAMVVIVGNLDKQQAQQTAEKLLKGLPVGQKPPPLPEVSLPQKATLQTIPFPSSQTHILLGLPSVTRQDEDYIPLYVGNYVLGGGSLVSRLFNEVREKRGLAYSASSYLSPMTKPGPFIVGLQTKNEQNQQALKVVNDTINDFIANGVSEEELVAAKKNITGGFVMRFDTNAKLLGYVSMIGFYDLPLDYLDTFTQRVEATTAAQIKQAFSRHILPQLFQTVTVGGAAAKK
jgi:zinc protease